MNISTPVLSTSFTKLFNKNIDRTAGMLYNNNVGDSVTFNGGRNRRYEKSSKIELKTKKNKGNFMDVIEQNFLDNFIKRYDIDTEVINATKRFLEVCNEKNNYKLKMSDDISYRVGKYTVIVTIPILDMNNSYHCNYNLEFDKNTGKCTDDW